jgi:hypothetical protein
MTKSILSLQNLLNVETYLKYIILGCSFPIFILSVKSMIEIPYVQAASATDHYPALYYLEPFYTILFGILLIDTIFFLAWILIFKLRTNNQKIILQTIIYKCLPLVALIGLLKIYIMDVMITHVVTITFFNNLKFVIDENSVHVFYWIIILCTLLLITIIAFSDFKIDKILRIKPNTTANC